MSSRQTADRCSFLKQNLDYCDEPSIFVIEGGFSGFGSCRKHIAAVLMFTMGEEAKGEGPKTTATVWPTWLWESNQAMEGRRRSRRE